MTVYFLEFAEPSLEWYLKWIPKNKNYLLNFQARAEHLTNEQLTDLLRREMKLSQQPKDVILSLF